MEGFRHRLELYGYFNNIRVRSYILNGAPIYAKARYNNVPAHIPALSLAGMPEALHPLPLTSDAIFPYRLPIFGILCHTD